MSVNAPFVGRETQLGALVSAVEAAELGERVVALVGGEPGIGKTRLVTEMAARVAAPVLWSSCWEGEGAPAYWPWQQLLRGLHDARGLGGGGPGGPELGRLLGQDDAADLGGGARFRVFDAVVDALGAAARRQPLVLVFDDLHWADEPSLLLLQFLARDPRAGGLALVGTYRDTDLGPGHPLLTHLGGIAREGLHVTLGGLGRRDVAALAAALAGEGGAGEHVAGAVSHLHRQTAGNPFFVRELVRLLDAGPDGQVALPGEVPTTVRAVVGQRLARLSPATRQALAAGSVVGPEFDAVTLAALVDREGDGVLAAIDEALEARLLRRAEGPGRFAFAHGLVREVLYDGLGRATRAELHRRMAQSVEARAGGGDIGLAELAHHLGEGAVTSEGRARAAAAAARAGAFNMQVLAYEEAAAWFAKATALVHADEGDSARVGALSLQLGEAALAAGDVPRARDAYQRAAAIARRNGDPAQLAEAALGLGAGFGGFEVRLLDPVQVQLLEEALAALGPQPSVLRAWVLARLSVALSFMGAEARRRALSEEAVAVARAVGDPRALGYALAGHCDAIADPGACEARRAEADEVVRLGLETGDRQLELLGRRLRLVAVLEVGEVAEADAEIERFALVADGLRQPLYRWYVPLWRGMRALMRGDREEAARQRAEAERIGGQAHSANATVLTFTQWWFQERLEGRFAQAGAALADLLAQDHAVTTWPRAIAAAQAGDHERVRALLGQWRHARLHVRVQDSEWLPETAQLAEAAALAGAREEAEILYEQLRPYAHRFCVEGIGAAFTGSVAWYLALVARFLGRAEEAADYAEQAAAAHRRVGLVGDPPPLAGPAGGPAPTAPAPAPAASLRREGDAWAVSYAGRTVRLRDSKGLGDLAVLLGRAGQEVHCLELMGGGDVGAGPGPAVDQEARRAYERRIRDLQEDVDEARAANDPVRAERAEAELDALVQQLAEAFGLSGRSRTTGSAAERARSAVGWRVRAAIRHAAETHPELGRHLGNAVRTGTWCSYRPETAVPWEIDDGQAPRA